GRSGSRRGGRGGRWPGGLRVLLDARHHVPLGDGLARLLQDAEHARAPGRQLHGGLVALQLEQHVVGSDDVAVVLLPARDLRLGDRFPEARDADLEHDSAQTRAKARVTSSISSAWCTLYDPLAGLAAASRPTYVSVRPPSSGRSSGSMNRQAPMFAGSSCTQYTCSAFG